MNEPTNPNEIGSKSVDGIEKPLPCPFCGAKALRHKDQQPGSRWEYHCPYGHTGYLRMKEWNTRQCLPIQVQTAEQPATPEDSSVVRQPIDDILKSIYDGIIGSVSPDDPKLDVAYAIARYLKIECPCAHEQRSDVVYRLRGIMTELRQKCRSHGEYCEICDGHAEAIDAAIAALTAPQQREGAGEFTSEAAFKNFHRSLCERFGYTHDEQFWWRDLVSLIEHIAKKAAPLRPVTDAEVLDIANALRVHGWAAGGDDQEFEDDVRNALQASRSRLAGEGT